jgi:GNAT superfamily N-acetyltransferase
MDQRELRRIAHEALALNASPMFRYQRDCNFVLRDDVAYSRQALPGPGFNWAAAVGRPVALNQIRRFGDSFFAGCAGGWGVLVEADAGHPVEAEIRNRGWAVAEEEPAFVLPEMPLPNGQSAALDIRRVNDAAGLRTFTESACTAFGTPVELLDQMMPPEASAVDPDIAYFVGWSNDQPVATAMMHKVGSTGCIAGVSVLAEFRRRGFGKAITAAAIAAAAAAGCRSAALRSGPMAVDLYRQLGFQLACVHKTYTVPLN